jgi:outer membrane protein TolC
MIPRSMRFARIACVLFALLGVSTMRARADVVGRALALVDDQTGGTPPPAQSADLTAWAGEARSTTLPELLQFTVRQAPSLASARYDIAIAQARIEQTWGRNDWVLQAQAQFTHANGIVADPVIVDRDDKFVGTVDLTRLLPTGGTVALHARSAYEDSRYHQFGIDPATGKLVRSDGSATTWNQDLSASITQPLLRNRGRAVFDANEAKAKASRDVAVLARRLAAIQAVQNVISAYWDLVLAERTVAITEQSLDLARERLRVTQIGADGGKVPRSEIPAVLQIIATREEDVLNGELSVLNSAIAVRRTAGMPIGAGEMGLRVATDLEPKDQTLELGSLVERAYAASPELAQLASQDASATLDVVVAENGLLPQLDAALQAGPTGTSNTFPDSWQNLTELKTFTITGTLSFSEAIGNHLASGKLHEARETRRKLTVNAFDIRAQIAQTMTRAVAQLELARRRVILSQRAIDLANENIKIETDRFNLGKSTNFDVLNRLEDLRQAELRKTQALIDWRKAEVVVQALTGDVLPIYGISLDEPTSAR